jgi:hypothetical protein
LKVEILKLKAGPELDTLVAKIVFGHDDAAAPPGFSTNIALAWSVRERMMRRGWNSDDHYAGHDGELHAYRVRFSRWQEPNGEYLARPVEAQHTVEAAADAPAAICKALSLPLPAAP